MTDSTTIYECTDLGNALRFVDQHSSQLKVIDGSFTWLQWNGQRWELVSAAKAWQAAKATVECIYHEGSNADPNEVMKLRQWAQVSQSKARMQAMLDLASKQQKMLVQLKDFDCHDLAVNTQSGLFFCNSGRVIPHKMTPMVTKITKASFNRDAQCPRFLQFLDEIFGGDQELITWMQRALGYSILGKTDEQCLFIAYGTGANGKSTLFEVIREVLGDYAKVTDFEIFLTSHKSDVRMLEAVGELAGVRFALASEVDSTKRFSESLIKRLTGGDTLRGTKLRQSSFEFRPQFSLWFLANHLPFAKDGSYGFWRRIKVVPFTRQFTSDRRDPHLQTKLLKERDGILGWLLQGAMDWIRLQEESPGSGFGPCQAVEDAIKAYREDNDFISQFLEEKVVPLEGSEVPARDLYEAYRNWASAQGDQYELSENLFSRRMAERGLEKRRTKNGHRYKGIALDHPWNF